MICLCVLPSCFFCLRCINFVDLLAWSLHPQWELPGHYFFKHFFSNTLFLGLLLHVCGNYLISHTPPPESWMFPVFFSIFSLCALKSSCWYIFNITDLFFHGILIIVNPILCVFRPQKFHWGFLKIFRSIPHLLMILSTFLSTHSILFIAVLTFQYSYPIILPFLGLFC